MKAPEARSALRIFFSFLILVLSFALPSMPSSNVAVVSPYPVTNTPVTDTPAKLREVWLRFHRDNLCEKVDAAFLFHKREMEVVVNINNENNNEKLYELLNPLRGAYGINLHTVRLRTERALIDIGRTPPSFWLNSELTEYLRDSFLRDASVVNAGFQFDTIGRPSSIMLGQRMLMFARDILEYNRKIRLYAAHLPLLARAALDPQADPDLRNEALDVCRAHAKKLEKYTKKLNSNLTRALPKTSNGFNEAVRPGAETFTAVTSVDIAVKLADEAEGLSRLVYRFVFPRTHTVELNDLRNPALLQSLKTLRGTTTEFRKSIG
jgi:hypothetical protein